MEYIKNMMPLNLQLFAEEGEEGEEDKGDEGNPDNAQSGEPEDGKAKVTTLTEDDVDRIVQKRLARARKKWDKDHTEAERLQKMTDDEKKQYEEDKRKEDLDNREAAITRRELTAVAKEQLNAAGVPAEKINKLSSDFRQSNAMKMVLNAQNTEFTNWAKKNKVKGADKIGKSGWSKDENLTKAYSKFTGASKIVKTVPQTLSFNGMGLSKDTKKQFQDVFLQNFDNVVFKMEGTAKGNQEVRETSEGKKIIYTDRLIN